MSDTDGSMEFEDSKYINTIDTVPPAYYRPLEELKAPCKKMVSVATQTYYGGEKRKSSANGNYNRTYAKQGQPPAAKKVNTDTESFPGTFTDNPLLLADTFPINKVHTKQISTGLLWNEDGDLVPVLRIIATFPRTVITLSIPEWNNMSRCIPLMLEYLDGDDDENGDKKFGAVSCGPKIKINFTHARSGQKAILISHKDSKADIYVLDSTIRSLSWRESWITQRLNHLTSVPGEEYKKVIISVISTCLWMELMSCDDGVHLSFGAIQEHIRGQFETLYEMMRANLETRDIDSAY